MHSVLKASESAFISKDYYHLPHLFLMYQVMQSVLYAMFMVEICNMLHKLLFTSLLSFTFCWNILVERWFSVRCDWYWIYWSRFSSSFPARTEKIMINVMLKDEPRKWLTGCAFVQSGGSQVDKAACRQHDGGGGTFASGNKLKTYGRLSLMKMQLLHKSCTFSPSSPRLYIDIWVGSHQGHILRERRNIDDLAWNLAMCDCC